MTELNLALIGGGAIARAHAAALRMLPFFFEDVPRWRPRLVCEASHELAVAAAQRLGFDEGAVGWEAALHRTDIDAVLVATPPDLHHDVVIAALRAGKHVLCEKPLARTAAEAAAMLSVAEETGRVAMVGFNYRCAPALLQAKRMLLEGACGDIYHVSGRYLQDFGRDPTRPLNWRYQAARGGSGALADIGSHLLDSIRWLAGDVASVIGVKRTVVGERPSTVGGPSAAVDVDDHAALLARFDSGALGSFEVSRVASGRGNGLQVEIYGTAGSLAFDWERNNELRYFSSLEPRDRQGFRRLIAGPAFPVYPAPLPVGGLGIGFMETMVVQLAEFARRIDGTPSLDVATFRDGFNVANLIDTVLRSAEQGNWLDVRRSE